MAQNKKNIYEVFTSFSELVDKLSIENIRLWHLKDDVMAMKAELESKGLKPKRKQEILEKLAKLSFQDVDIVKKRSALKKAIDQMFVSNVQAIIKGKKTVVLDEHKAYGRKTRKKIK